MVRAIVGIAALSVVALIPSDIAGPDREAAASMLAMRLANARLQRTGQPDPGLGLIAPVWTFAGPRQRR